MRVGPYVTLNAGWVGGTFLDGRLGEQRPPSGTRRRERTLGRGLDPLPTALVKPNSRPREGSKGEAQPGPHSFPFSCPYVCRPVHSREKSCILVLGLFFGAGLTERDLRRDSDISESVRYGSRIYWPRIIGEPRCGASRGPLHGDTGFGTGTGTSGGTGTDTGGDTGMDGEWLLLARARGIIGLPAEELLR